MTTESNSTTENVKGKNEFNCAPMNQELKTMLMAITEEKSLQLRPSGKCLFNPIKAGDVKKVLQLIATGVNPNHRFATHKNNTPLHIAAFHGFTGIVSVLLQYGAFIDAVNDDLETPLILAVESNKLSVVQHLIHAGALCHVTNKKGVTALHVASKNGSREIAQLLLNTKSFDINLQDDGGWTPLVWACEHDCVDFVCWLLELGANPNLRDNEENTALHWTACSGSTEILEVLLEWGCNITFVNERGDSALHIAARKDNYDCVQLLLNRGAQVDCRNKDNETPLMCCDMGTQSLRVLKRHSAKSSKLPQNVICRDISRGSETFPIEIVNNVDQEEFEMNFQYVLSNCFPLDVSAISTVDSMQQCSCTNNCTSDSCTCSQISKCWYGLDGCLVPDFNMNDPPCIYECNKLCYCPKSCVNRVVQKGMRHPLQVFKTRNQGWGIRALTRLPKGAFVCEYVGEVVTGAELEQRNDDTYVFDLESTAGDFCIDGQYYSNVGRFINHSCDPNLAAVRVFVEHQDQNFPRIAFFTVRDVPAYEELCFDYGFDFWIVKCHSVLCTCSSQLCKYSKDSIDETLQAYVNMKLHQELDAAV